MSRHLLEKKSPRAIPFAKFTAAAVVSLSLAGLVVGAGASGVILKREGAEGMPSGAGPVVQNDAPGTTGPPAKSIYLRRDRLQPRLRDALGVFGDRLERAGQERVILGGTLSVTGQGAASHISVTRELSDRMHVEEGISSQRRSLHFDGGQMSKVGSTADAADESLLETLINDSAEHFFAGQFQGLGTRFLGFRFRLDDGTDASYSGPFYDVYQVEDRVNVGGNRRERVKLYYFNSDTRLLERVRYEVERGGVPVAVEVVFSEWQRVQGQMVPRLVTRAEGGATVFTLRVETVGFVPRAADGTFTVADEQ